MCSPSSWSWSTWLMDLVYIVVDPAHPGEVMTDVRSRSFRRVIAERQALAPSPAFADAFCRRVRRPSTLIAARGRSRSSSSSRSSRRWLAPYDPLAQQSILQINKPPSWEHWLGTDQFGRDVLSRMIYGSRNSLIFGLLSPVFAAIVRDDRSA